MDRLAMKPFAEREPRVEIRLTGGETYPHEGLPRHRIRISARPAAGQGTPHGIPRSNGRGDGIRSRAMLLDRSGHSEASPGVPRAETAPCASDRRRES